MVAALSYDRHHPTGAALVALILTFGPISGASEPRDTVLNCVGERNRRIQRFICLCNVREEFPERSSSSRI
jgi:hypothetical protein